MNNEKELLEDLKRQEQAIKSLIINNEKVLIEYMKLRDIMMIFLEHMKYLPIHEQRTIKHRLEELSYQKYKDV